jgi:choline sulfatase
MKKTIISVALFLTCVTSYSQSKRPKNILLILTDDLQKTCIHAYGCDQVVSPNIDWIVNNGVSFNHVYTNGSMGGALSMPSRAMLVTGRGLFQICEDGRVIPESHTTLPEQLQQEGYTTFATGKWHSDTRSFNRSFAQGENIFFGGMHSYQTNGHVSPRLVHYDPTGAYNKQVAFTGEKFSSEMFADAAIDFLKSRKKNDKPFFAYVAFTSPHDPRNQHPSYGQSYDADSLDLPVNYLPCHPFNNGEMKVRDEVLLPTPRTEEGIKKELAGYYGMISEVDTQIGRILKTLRDNKEMENTILIFASDNGLAVGRHGLLGKQNLYDHSIRVPLVIIAPGLDKGAQKDINCYLYDIYPTLCEMTGIKPAPSVTGKSLVPVLNNNKKHRDHIFLAYSSIQRALVKDGWKYIIYNVDGCITEQLFDLRNDPWEMKDLAKDSAYTSKISTYKQILKEEMKENNDFCNLDTHTWWGENRKINKKDLKNFYPVPEKK